MGYPDSNSSPKSHLYLEALKAFLKGGDMPEGEKISMSDAQLATMVKCICRDANEPSGWEPEDPRT